jgi:predicted O-methyltransferase YrrM
MASYTPESSRGWIVGSTFDGSLSSWRISRTLKKMAADPEARGHSDKGVQNLIYTLAVSLRPRRVLEIGTHIGMGAVIIGQALKTNGYGRLITLEPAKHYYAISSKYVRAAGVADYVQIVPNYSHDPSCKAKLKEETPFELIFIDGAHDYSNAAHDIALCAELLCDNGVMVLHDVGSISESLDPTGRGGVRQALWDFCEDNREFQAIFLEFPVWLNNTGTAVVSKQRLDPPMSGSLTKASAATDLSASLGIGLQNSHSD